MSENSKEMDRVFASGFPTEPLASLAKQFKLMHRDLEKCVRRSDSRTLGARWFGQIGVSATAGASAVAGASLTAHLHGLPATVVGVATLACGVIGGIAAALKLSESVERNRKVHASYLELLRNIGGYIVATLPTATIADATSRLESFAGKIKDVELSDIPLIAAAGGSPGLNSLATTPPSARPLRNPEG